MTDAAQVQSHNTLINNTAHCISSCVTEHKNSTLHPWVREPQANNMTNSLMQYHDQPRPLPSRGDYCNENPIDSSLALRGCHGGNCRIGLINHAWQSGPAMTSSQQPQPLRNHVSSARPRVPIVQYIDRLHPRLSHLSHTLAKRFSHLPFARMLTSPPAADLVPALDRRRDLVIYCICGAAAI